MGGLALIIVLGLVAFGLSRAVKSVEPTNGEDGQPSGAESVDLQFEFNIYDAATGNEIESSPLAVLGSGQVYTFEVKITNNTTLNEQKVPLTIAGQVVIGTPTWSLPADMGSLHLPANSQVIVFRRNVTLPGFTEPTDGQFKVVVNSPIEIQSGRDLLICSGECAVT